MTRVDTRKLVRIINGIEYIRPLGALIAIDKIPLSTISPRKKSTRKISME
jgi:hypothetical protein